ncbi:hypothetical protein EI77_02890 [Prosthecobacter fusiformis]|uniref:Uncharacterized protein n=1 Tax=Prosthecobacter fusiformis TaxID=48464 RepID=A0A4R7RU29_9BACT|nr:hypothetical protein [Prosthecobacter fusiformis]TDU69242.1 hypothetical protein EI77_02890 [Prosthecobacter fusiformis]
MRKGSLIVMMKGKSEHLQTQYSSAHTQQHRITRYIIVNTNNLTTYLKDHLAGSVAAIELLDHLITLYAGRPEADQMKGLKSEVAGDQELLKSLLDRYETHENLLKKAGAWIAEKGLQIKVKSSEGDLGLLISLEVLVLGIEGKLRLWRSLQGLDTGLDLPHLQSAAHRQIHQVEVLRLEAAEKAFS